MKYPVFEGENNVWDDFRFSLIVLWITTLNFFSHQVMRSLRNRSSEERETKRGEALLEMEEVRKITLEVQRS